MRTDLALDALDMGLWARQRAGQDVTGLIHHSDREAQYRAVRYTERLAEAEAVASVGSKGDSYDNAMAEALNSLFKAECIRPRSTTVRTRSSPRSNPTNRVSTKPGAIRTVVERVDMRWFGPQPPRPRTESNLLVGSTTRHSTRSRNTGSPTT